MHFSSLIFDLDGTLWDSTIAFTKAYNNVFKQHQLNLEISLQDIRRLMGLPADEYFQKILIKAPSTQQSELTKALIKEEILVVKELSNQLFYPGVIEGINKLKNNYDLYIVSNCQTNYLEAFIKHTSIGELFIDSE